MYPIFRSLRHQASTASRPGPLRAISYLGRMRRAETDGQQISGLPLDAKAKIQEYSIDNNLPFSLRPTDWMVLHLQGQGYAAKNTDIHDKSSDVGLSGFVPADSYFAKNYHPGQTPTPSTELNKVAPDGSPATAQHLKVSAELFEEYKKLGYLTTSRSQSAPVVAEDLEVFDIQDRAESTIKLAVVTEGDERAVYWFDQANLNQELQPYHCWAYPDGANGHDFVTGDCDIASFSPHLSDSYDFLIPFAVEGPHGKSYVARGEQVAIDSFNALCHRTDNPLFQHGAENRNLHFTQPYDEALHHFNPTGDKKIELSNLAEHDLSLMTSGHLVHRNPQLNQFNPKFGGQETSNSKVAASAEAVGEALQERTLSRLNAKDDPVATAMQQNVLFNRALSEALNDKQIPDETKAKIKQQQATTALIDQENWQELLNQAEECQQVFGWNDPQTHRFKADVILRLRGQNEFKLADFRRLIAKPEFSDFVIEIHNAETDNNNHFKAAITAKLEEYKATSHTLLKTAVEALQQCPYQLATKNRPQIDALLQNESPKELRDTVSELQAELQRAQQKRKTLGAKLSHCCRPIRQSEAATTYETTLAELAQLAQHVQKDELPVQPQAEKRQAVRL